VGKIRREIKTLGISENTILWFCSDNGGLAGFSATGGRGAKGQIYEGGLRVPAIMEWPARIPENKVSDFPSFTSDIYPTLLEIAGVTMKAQTPLDGISLVQLIDNKIRTREKPMGFWQFPARGKVTPSAKLMAELLKEQEAGLTEVADSLPDSDAGEIKIKYDGDLYPGHSAWLDWPYKLHRIDSENREPLFELYNLETDPGETNDLSASMPEKVISMKKGIEAWLKSVVNSLNGDDYI
ncbi:MAG TPA: N-acetylgalactosamine 6-sulfate sulfatase, partial [Bacteroidales bacterium]|nr:N-acetylgalactosamine 6-sulfate sulfatase [Bacteroidales bacterium]